MLDMISGTIGGLKTASELAKSMLDIRDAAMMKTKISELYGVILSAQESALAANADQLTLLKQKGELEARLLQFETWDAEKQRYKLERLEPGVFVRALKPEMANGEPPHQICAACYENGKKFPLQGDEENNGRQKLRCQGCGTVVTVGRFVPPTNDRPRRRLYGG